MGGLIHVDRPVITHVQNGGPSERYIIMIVIYKPDVMGAKLKKHHSKPHALITIQMRVTRARNDISIHSDCPTRTKQLEF